MQTSIDRAKAYMEKANRLKYSKSRDRGRSDAYKKIKSDCEKYIEENKNKPKKKKKAKVYDGDPNLHTNYDSERTKLWIKERDELIKQVEKWEGEKKATKDKKQGEYLDFEIEVSQYTLPNYDIWITEGSNLEILFQKIQKDLDYFKGEKDQKELKAELKVARSVYEELGLLKIDYEKYLKILRELWAKRQKSNNPTEIAQYDREIQMYMSLLLGINKKVRNLQGASYIKKGDGVAQADSNLVDQWQKEYESLVTKTIPSWKSKQSSETDKFKKEYAQFEVGLGEDKMPNYEYWIKERQVLEKRMHECKLDLDYFKEAKDQEELGAEKKDYEETMEELSLLKRDYEEYENILRELWKRRGNCKDPIELEQINDLIILRQTQMLAISMCSKQRAGNATEKRVKNKKEFNESRYLYLWRCQYKNLKKAHPEFQKKAKNEKDEAIKAYWEFEVWLHEEKDPEFDLWINERKNLEQQQLDIWLDLGYFKGEKDQKELKEEKVLCDSVMQELMEYKTDYEELEELLRKLWRFKRDCKDPVELARLEKEIEIVMIKFKGLKQKMKGRNNSGKRGELEKPLNAKSEILLQWKKEYGLLQDSIPEYQTKYDLEKDQAEKEYYNFEVNLRSDKRPHFARWIEERTNLERTEAEIIRDQGYFSDPKEQKELKEELKLNTAVIKELEILKKEYEEYEARLRELWLKKKNCKDPKELAIINAQIADIEGKLKILQGKSDKRNPNAKRGGADDVQDLDIEALEVWISQRKDLQDKKLPEYTQKAASEKNPRHQEYWQCEKDFGSEKLPNFGTWIKERDNLEKQQKDIKKDLDYYKNPKDQTDLKSELAVNQDTVKEIAKLKKDHDDLEATLRALWLKKRDCTDPKEREEIQKEIDAKNEKLACINKQCKERKVDPGARNNQPKSVHEPSATYLQWVDQQGQNEKNIPAFRDKKNKEQNPEQKEYLQFEVDLCNKKTPNFQYWVAERDQIERTQTRINDDLSYFKKPDSQKELKQELNDSETRMTSLEKAKKDYEDEEDKLRALWKKKIAEKDPYKKDCIAAEIRESQIKLDGMKQGIKERSDEGIGFKRTPPGVPREDPFEKSQELQEWKAEEETLKKEIPINKEKLAKETDPYEKEYLEAEIGLAEEKLPNLKWWNDERGILEKQIKEIKDDQKMARSPQDKKELQEELEVAEETLNELKQLKKDYDEYEDLLKDLYRKLRHTKDPKAREELLKQIAMAKGNLAGIKNKMAAKQAGKAPVDKSSELQKWEDEKKDLEKFIDDSEKKLPGTPEGNDKKLLEFDLKQAKDKQPNLNDWIDQKFELEEQSAQLNADLKKAKDPSAQAEINEQLEVNKQLQDEVEQMKKDYEDIEKNMRDLMVKMLNEKDPKEKARLAALLRGEQEKLNAITNQMNEKAGRPLVDLPPGSAEIDELEIAIENLKDRIKNCKDPKEKARLQAQLNDMETKLANLKKYEAEKDEQKREKDRDLKREKQAKTADDINFWKKEQEKDDANMRELTGWKKDFDKISNKIDDAHKIPEKSSEDAEKLRENQKTRDEMAKWLDDHIKLQDELRKLKEKRANCTDPAEKAKLDKLINDKHNQIKEHAKNRPGKQPDSEEINELEDHIKNLKDQIKNCKDPRLKAILEQELSDALDNLEVLKMYQAEKDATKEKQDEDRDRARDSEDPDDRKYFTREVIEGDDKLKDLENWKGDFDKVNECIEGVRDKQKVVTDPTASEKLKEDYNDLKGDRQDMVDWLKEKIAMEKKLRDLKKKRADCKDPKMRELLDKQIKEQQDLIKEHDKKRPKMPTNPEIEALEDDIKRLKNALENETDPEKRAQLAKEIAEKEEKLKALRLWQKEKDKVALQKALDTDRLLNAKTPEEKQYFQNEIEAQEKKDRSLNQWKKDYNNVNDFIDQLKEQIAMTNDPDEKKKLEQNLADAEKKREDLVDWLKELGKQEQNLRDLKNQLANEKDPKKRAELQKKIDEAEEKLKIHMDRYPGESAEISDLENRIAAAEEKLKNCKDPKERAALERQIEAMKIALGGLQMMENEKGIVQNKQKTDQKKEGSAKNPQDKKWYGDEIVDDQRQLDDLEKWKKDFLPTTEKIENELKRLPIINDQKRIDEAEEDIAAQEQKRDDMIQWLEDKIAQEAYIRGLKEKLENTTDPKEREELLKKISEAEDRRKAHEKKYPGSAPEIQELQSAIDAAKEKLKNCKDPKERAELQKKIDEMEKIMRALKDWQDEKDKTNYYKAQDEIKFDEATNPQEKQFYLDEIKEADKAVGELEDWKDDFTALNKKIDQAREKGVPEDKIREDEKKRDEMIDWLADKKALAKKLRELKAKRESTTDPAARAALEAEIAAQQKKLNDHQEKYPIEDRDVGAIESKLDALKRKLANTKDPKERAAIQKQIDELEEILKAMKLWKSEKDKTNDQLKKQEKRAKMAVDPEDKVYFENEVKEEQKKLGELKDWKDDFQHLNKHVEKQRDKLLAKAGNPDAQKVIQDDIDACEKERKDMIEWLKEKAAMEEKLRELKEKRANCTDPKEKAALDEQIKKQQDKIDSLLLKKPGKLKEVRDLEDDIDDLKQLLAQCDDPEQKAALEALIAAKEKELAALKLWSEEKNDTQDKQQADKQKKLKATNPEDKEWYDNEVKEGEQKLKDLHDWKKQFNGVCDTIRKDEGKLQNEQDPGKKASIESKIADNEKLKDELIDWLEKKRAMEQKLRDLKAKREACTDPKERALLDEQIKALEKDIRAHDRNRPGKQDPAIQELEDALTAAKNRLANCNDPNERAQLEKMIAEMEAALQAMKMWQDEKDDMEEKQDFDADKLKKAKDPADVDYFENEVKQDNKDIRELDDWKDVFTENSKYLQQNRPEVSHVTDFEKRQEMEKGIEEASEKQADMIQWLEDKRALQKQMRDLKYKRANATSDAEKALLDKEIAQVQDKLDNLEKKWKPYDPQEEIDEITDEIEALRRKLANEKDPKKRAELEKLIAELEAIKKALEVFKREKDGWEAKKKKDQENYKKNPDPAARITLDKEIKDADKRLGDLSKWKKDLDKTRRGLKDIRTQKAKTPEDLAIHQQEKDKEQELKDHLKWIHDKAKLEAQLRELKARREQTKDPKVQEFLDKQIKDTLDKLAAMEKWKKDRENLKNFIKETKDKIEKTSDPAEKAELEKELAYGLEALKDLDDWKHVRDNIEENQAALQEKKKNASSTKEKDQLQNQIYALDEKLKQHDKFQDDKRELETKVKNLQEALGKTYDPQIKEALAQELENEESKLDQLKNWKKHENDLDLALAAAQEQFKTTKDQGKKSDLLKDMADAEAKGKRLGEMKSAKEELLKRLEKARKKVQETMDPNEREKWENECCDIEGKIRKIDALRKEDECKNTIDQAKKELKGCRDPHKQSQLEKMMEEAKQQLKDMEELKKEAADKEKALQDIIAAKKKAKGVAEQNELEKLRKEAIANLQDYDGYMAKKDHWERVIKDARDTSKDTSDPVELAALEEQIKYAQERLRELDEGRREGNAIQDDLNMFRERQKETEDPTEKEQLAAAIASALMAKKENREARYNPTKEDRELNDERLAQRDAESEAERQAQQQKIALLKEQMRQEAEKRKEDRRRRRQEFDDVKARLAERQAAYEEEVRLEQQRQREEEERREQERIQKENERRQRRKERDEARKRNDERAKRFRAEKNALLKRREQLMKQDAEYNSNSQALHDRIKAIRDRMMERRKRFQENQALKAKIQQKIDEFQDRKRELEREMEGIDLTSAREACQKIDNEDVSFLKGLRTPPERIKITLECVCCIIYNNIKKISWDDLKKLIQDIDFRSNIINYDPIVMSDKVLKRVKTEFVGNPNWDLKKITRAARSAGYMADWADQVIKYKMILVKNKPLLDKAREFQTEEKGMADDFDKIREIEGEEQTFKMDDENAEQEIQVNEEKKQVQDKNSEEIQPEIEDVNTKLAKMVTNELDLEEIVESEPEDN